MSCRYAHDDGAYVLGALSPTERLDFEKHLSGCDRCRHAVGELAGLPGLLGRVDPGVLEDPAPAERAPEGLLPGLIRDLRRRRRRRILAAAGAAAAAASVVIGLTVSQSSSEDAAAPGPTPVSPSGAVAAPVQEMQPVAGDVPVRAEVSLESVTWGTRLGLTCTYDPESVSYELPPAVDYTLFVRTQDGRTEQVGSWRSVGGKTMQLSAATAARRDDIAAVEVRSPGVGVVLRLAP